MITQENKKKGIIRGGPFRFFLKNSDHKSKSYLSLENVLHLYLDSLFQFAALLKLKRVIYMMVGIQTISRQHNLSDASIVIFFLIAELVHYFLSQQKTGIFYFETKRLINTEKDAHIKIASYQRSLVREIFIYMESDFLCLYVVYPFILLNAAGGWLRIWLEVAYVLYTIAYFLIYKLNLHFYLLGGRQNREKYSWLWFTNNLAMKYVFKFLLEIQMVFMFVMVPANFSFEWDDNSIRFTHALKCIILVLLVLGEYALTNYLIVNVNYYLSETDNHEEEIEEGKQDWIFGKNANIFVKKNLHVLYLSKDFERHWRLDWIEDLRKEGRRIWLWRICYLLSDLFMIALDLERERVKEKRKWKKMRQEKRKKRKEKREKEQVEAVLKQIGNKSEEKVNQPRRRTKAPKFKRSSLVLSLSKIHSILGSDGHASRQDTNNARIDNSDHDSDSDGDDDSIDENDNEDSKEQKEHDDLNGIELMHQNDVIGEKKERSGSNFV